MEKVIVTGAAGFIGHHLCKALIANGYHVLGCDSLNNYYDIRLKKARLADLEILPLEYGKICKSSSFENIGFVLLNLEDRRGLERLFMEEKPSIAVNLAAQAGVRYSLENPQVYIDSNVTGFLNVLECCRSYPVRHLLYASSSSVYGGNEKVPFSEKDPVEHPVSLYAATKRSNELLAEVYARLFGIASSGLRFFTVYGPWGRPDMAPMLFADAITHGKPIKVFNNGEMERDFTFIEDVVRSVMLLLDKEPRGTIPTTVYNVGCGSPVKLMDFIRTMENALGKKAVLEYLPMQKGDVVRTWADTSYLREKTGYAPVTTLKEGIATFAGWYKSASNPLL